jgi:hypothetical protein
MYPRERWDHSFLAFLFSGRAGGQDPTDVKNCLTMVSKVKRPALLSSGGGGDGTLPIVTWPAFNYKNQATFKKIIFYFVHYKTLRSPVFPQKSCNG